MSNTTIRLVGRGWERFTGTMGHVPFESGTSTRACTQREVDHLAAITRIETEDGEALGIAERLKGGATIPAEVKPPLARQTEKAKSAEEREPIRQDGEVAKEMVRHSVEDLQKVADEKGLAGLREIAGPRGLKGRSINDLIKEILEDQEKRLGKAPTQEPAKEEPAKATTSAGVVIVQEKNGPDLGDEFGNGGPDTALFQTNFVPDTPAIDGEQDANAQAAAALSQSQDA